MAKHLSTNYQKNNPIGGENPHMGIVPYTFQPEDDMTKPQFNYVFLTVSRNIDARLIGEYINTNTKEKESMESRLLVLLAGFAREAELGFMPSLDGKTFVFYEEAHVSQEMVADFLGESLLEVAA